MSALNPRSATRWAALGCGLFALAAGGDASRVGPPPTALVGGWGLSPVYAKHLDVGGFPVLASARVSDAAVAEAGYLVDRLIGRRPDLLAALAAAKIRLVVMAPTEMTTAVPDPERPHLDGFAWEDAPAFAWPADAPPLDEQGEPLAWIPLYRAPEATPREQTAATEMLFVNHCAQPVEVDWLDFDGERRLYFTLRPGARHLQRTYAGHVWVVREGEEVLGVVAASGEFGRVDIRFAPR